VSAHKCASTWTPVAGVSSPPVSSLTREVLYIAPIRIGSSRRKLVAHQTFSSHGLRAQVCGRVGASGTSSASSSSARVKTGDHIFGEFLRHVYSFRDVFCNVLLLGVVFLFMQGSKDRHCNLSARHRAGRLYHQALCRLAPAWMPLGITSFESSL
jgi:hypothetical protein